MRLFIDESLLPKFAIRLNKTGRHDATHPLHVGRRGAPDHAVVQRCIAEDRVIVTQNARDCRKPLGGVEIHPGLIVLPVLDREATWRPLHTSSPTF
jgi:hypothetical protein